MGRHNHENSVAIPGYGKPVVLSGDDTFVTNPAQSQLYSYIADDSDAVWNDEGDLWAFVPTASTTTTTSRSARPERDRQVREGPEGRRDRTQARRHRPDGGRQGLLRRRTAAGSGCEVGLGIDGPQWVLEHWGDTQLKRLPVRAGRGHRVRQAARDAERRLRRRQRPRAIRPASRARQPGRSRRTAVSGSSCSTRATRRR